MADEGRDWSQTGSLLGPTTVRWYPAVQWLDGDGFADLLRSTSLYRGLYRRVREPCSTRAPSGSARGWATGHHAAT
jgi:hypothetical protein